MTHDVLAFKNVVLQWQMAAFFTVIIARSSPHLNPNTLHISPIQFHKQIHLLSEMIQYIVLLLQQTGDRSGSVWWDG